MKNKNSLYLLGGIALLGGGAYVAFKKGMFSKKEIITPTDIKDEQKQKAIEDALIAEEKARKASANSMSNPNSFMSKVAVVQGKLGVSIDGKVGPQTRKALTAKFPSVTDLTTKNIDSVITMFSASATADPKAVVSTRLKAGTNVIANGNFTASAIATRNNRWLTTDADGNALPKRVFKAEEQIGVVQYYLDNSRMIINLTTPISEMGFWANKTFNYIVVTDSQVK